MAQGERMSGEGSCRVAGVLRLPRRALAAPANQQSNREYVRNGASANLSHQRPRLTRGRTGNGLQADAQSRITLEKTERQREVARIDRRHRVRRRRTNRRLTWRDRPQLLEITP